MGQQVCKAVEQRQFKARIGQLCNSVEQGKQVHKLQPITFSDQLNPSQNKYLDLQNGNNQQQSFSKLQSTKQQLRPIVKSSQYFISQQSKDPIKQSRIVQQSQKQNSKNEVTKSNLNISRDRNYSQQTASPTRKIKLDINQIYLKHVHSNHQQGNINYQPISVPFSVVKMILSEKLVNYIKHDNQNFFSKYQNDKQSFKLYKSGCYGYAMSHNFGIFLNADYFYEGTFTINEKGQFIPSQRGTYINQSGKYKGQLKDGKPHGKGKYYQVNKNAQNQFPAGGHLSVNSKSDKLSQFSNQNPPRSPKNNTLYATVFQGQWQNGILKQGTIQNNIFSYSGSLKNRKPHGLGSLVLKQRNISYKGQFVDGKFQGVNSLYQTPDYTYSGQFKKGKKNGKGVLLQKVNKLKNNRGKIRLQQKYDGIWKQDKFYSIQSASNSKI